jgi:hypothetical protein
MTGLQTLISQAAKNIHQITLETLNQGESKFLGIFEKRLGKKTEQAIAAASTLYVEQYLEKYGKINLFGFDTSVPLDELYTEMYCWLSPQPELLNSLENPRQESSLPSRSGEFANDPWIGKQLALDTVHEHQYLVVFGVAGAGKSTFLRKIGLDTLQGKKLGKFLPRTYFPVLISCKTLKLPELNLEKCLVDLFRSARFPLAEKLTKKALEQGKLLILLDGVNELDSEQRPKTIAQIERFIEQYPNNYFIASDRIGHPNPWQKFIPVALSHFSLQQIAEGIHHWFTVVGDRENNLVSPPQTPKANVLAKSFIEALEQPEYQRHKIFAQVPLLLNLLCFLYFHNHNLPDNRILLYEQALEIVLGKISLKLNQSLVKSWLSQIAYQGLFAEKFCFLRTELISQMPGQICDGETKESPEDILNAIAIETGILLPISADLLTFAHPTLQEFFAAEYIIEHRLIANIVTESLTVWRWQEVLLFFSGLKSPNADKLLLLIEASTQEYLNPESDAQNDGKLELKLELKKDANKLRSLLTWAEQATTRTSAKNSETILPAAKRTAALFTAFALQQTFQQENPLINELDLTLNNDLLLINSLKLSNILGLNLTDIIHNTRGLTNDFRQNLTFALSHPLDIDKLSRNLTRSLARKLAQDRARYLSLSFDQVLANQPEISLDRARDLAFVGIVAQQLQTMSVFGDISPLVVALDELQTQIPGNNDSSEVHCQFRQLLWETWLNSFQLDPQLLNLTPGEKQTLTDYFSACYLLVKCRDVARNITPGTWEAISGRMVQAI